MSSVRSPVRLERRPIASSRPVELDPSQALVVEHAARPGAGPLLALAGPGTGKSTTLVEAVAARATTGEPLDSVLVLTFSRRAAAELRERIAARVGRATVEPLARTFHSYAFGVLRRHAATSGDPPPRLLSGAEQDRVVRDLLHGDLTNLDGESGVGGGSGVWPVGLRPALLARGFAQELRDLLLRCAERGIDASQVIDLGVRSDREDWQAVGRFMRQYAEVTSLAFHGAYDPAELVRAVLDLWRSSPDLLAKERAERRLVLVDELQDADPAQLELLEQLAGGGRDLIAVGDPDQAIYGFRGSDPDGIRTFADRFRDRRGRPAPVATLRTCRRSGPELVAATRRLSARLGGRGDHRALVTPEPATAASVETHILRSAAQEAAYVAARLREEHLRRGVPWSQMAVLVRGGAGAVPTLRRALTAASVPVTGGGDEGEALGDQPVVAELIQLVRCALRPELLDEAAAESLILSPFGGGDSLSLRRLRFELARISDSTESSDTTGSTDLAATDHLASALRCPEELSVLTGGGVAAARQVAQLLQAVKASSDSGASPEDVLWAVWSLSGLEARWVRASEHGGRRGAAADRNLDAMLELFAAAGRFSDRLPGAGVEVFLEEVAAEQLPSGPVGGRLASSRPDEAVAVLTAHASKGLEWDVVFLAGVQEGRWPDLRRRGTLLGRDELLRAAKAGPGEADERVGVSAVAASAMAFSGLLDEERRLYYVAATRARRLLVCTAVRSEREELSPSRFLDELLPAEGDADLPFTEVPRALDFSALVSELRSATLQSDGATREAAARHLARLADLGVAGAAPAEWYAIAPLSDDGPLAGPEDKVSVSPSKVEAFLRCELRWFLEQIGATEGDTGAAGVGTAVHALAADLAEEYAADAPQSAARPSEAEILQRLDVLLKSVDLGSGWAAQRSKDQAADMARRLAAWLASNVRGLVGAELAFEVEVGRARLCGRVDRLERDASGRGVVVDLKTGSSAPPRAELDEHPQLAMYQLAITRGAFGEVLADGEPGGAELVHLGKAALASGARVQVQPPPADPAEAQRTLELVAEGMAGAAFRAMDNRLCRTCPVATSCPVQDSGRMVGP